MSAADREALQQSIEDLRDDVEYILDAYEILGTRRKALVLAKALLRVASSPKPNSKQVATIKRVLRALDVQLGDRDDELTSVADEEQSPPARRVEAPLDPDPEKAAEKAAEVVALMEKQPAHKGVCKRERMSETWIELVNPSEKVDTSAPLNKRFAQANWRAEKNMKREREKVQAEWLLRFLIQ